MGKKKKTAARQPMTWIIITCVLVSFIAGAGFSAFQLGNGSPGTASMPSGVSSRIAALKAEVTRNPDNVNAWINLGNTYFDSDQYQASIDAYSRALELDPLNANVITDMGVMFRRSGRPEKAVEAFDRAIAADPTHETSRMNKGIVMLNDLNDTRGAVAAWEGLLQLNPYFMVGNGKSLKEIVAAYKEES